MSRLYRINAAIGAVSMAALVLVTVADVVARYALSAPIHTAMESISYMLALLVITGYALVTRDQSHISVGILAELVPGIARVERWVTAFATLAGTFLLTWLLYAQAHRHIANGQRGDTTGLPLGWVQMGLTILSTAAILFAVTNLLRLFWRTAPQD
jgi:TRAP-type C4-dicarboxylate transport system, small permease component